jgi:FixJ family two-component response regulator
MEERGEWVIAVVDDDESIRRSVTNLLSSLGFRAEAFASAEAFLESADRDSTRCLVLDLRMPGISGLDLLAHLADTGQHIPAVILTARGDDELRERALQAGASAFLCKPFHSNALVVAV